MDGGTSPLTTKTLMVDDQTVRAMEAALRNAP